MKTALSHIVAVFACFGGAATAQDLSFYGTPGLIDTPDAYVLDDGEIALTSAVFGGTTRNTFTFQLSPRIEGVFRYSIIRDFTQVGDRFDRSFDISYQLAGESEVWPALKVGLRDFGGTGIYASEFIAASKTIVPDVVVTAGLGWGRLAGRNSFGNPLGLLAEGFKTRGEETEGGLATTGQLDPRLWFRGDAAVFGGVNWHINDKVTLVAEYAPDLYLKETEGGVIDVQSPLNVGLSYHFDNGVTLGGYYLYGTDIGARFSYVFDPAQPAVPGTVDSGPVPIFPRASVAAQSWNIAADANDRNSMLARRFGQDGLTLENISLLGRVADIRFVNTRFPASAQALGRAARIAANTLPVSVDQFDLTLLSFGMPMSTTTIMRADLEELEFAFDNIWQTQARARFDDGVVTNRAGELPGLYPAFRYNIAPFVTPSFFDPQSPIRAEAGASITFAYAPQPGTIVSGEVKRTLFGNISDTTRQSDSVLPRVRSDIIKYFQQAETEIAHLTGEYFFRPGPDMFGRVTVGYLERMFGGVSAEVLWYPVDNRLALGAELNVVRQRDFDQLFGFQDYQIVTGHVSAYYDLGNGFRAQADAGRYLAGDWGATFGLDREFNNGFKVGAFFTLTDVPFEDFGEGSFDKGIRITIPNTWLTGQPTQATTGQVIRPILRDGGARLSVRNRLYDLTRNNRAQEITDSWGMFLR